MRKPAAVNRLYPYLPSVTAAAGAANHPANSSHLVAIVRITHIRMATATKMQIPKYGMMFLVLLLPVLATRTKSKEEGDFLGDFGCGADLELPYMPNVTRGKDFKSQVSAMP